MQTQLARLKALMDAGDYRAALRLCAKWHDLGAQKERITRGQAAACSPGFYRELGHDPDALVADAIAAIRERYGFDGGNV